MHVNRPADTDKQMALRARMKWNLSRICTLSLSVLSREN